MRRLIFAALLFAASSAAAQSYRSGQLEVRRPWSRPAAAGTTGVGYLVIANRGGRPEVLTGATSPIAREVQIHRSSMAGGVMSMARQDRVATPPHGEVSFAPGGYHLMFADLRRSLKAGDQFPATLEFAGGRRITARFEVRAGGPPMAGMAH